MKLARNTGFTDSPPGTPGAQPPSPTVRFATPIAVSKPDADQDVKVDGWQRPKALVIPATPTGAPAHPGAERRQRQLAASEANLQHSTRWTYSAAALTATCLTGAFTLGYFCITVPWLTPYFGLAFLLLCGAAAAGAVTAAYGSELGHLRQTLRDLRR